MDYTLNCNGRLLNLHMPQVMGILNVTPDSFFAGSRQQTEEDIILRVRQIMQEGGAMIDVGGCSTRPDSEAATEKEEMERLRFALEIVRREAPDAIVSVDTFRPDIARMAVEEYGVDMINDVTEGHESDMFRMVARLGVPYVLTSCQATTREVLLHFAREVDELRSYGQKDIVLDPGFGFGKTLEQNYEIMGQLRQLSVMSLPVMVGISRKSMIYKLLDTDPQHALNGTTALHTAALLQGASILRVHDVREAVECVALVEKLKLCS